MLGDTAITTLVAVKDLARDGDIHRNGAVKMAWFKDPSGNMFEVNGR